LTCHAGHRARDRYGAFASTVTFSILPVMANDVS
jgi:hypothetical protein